jgi:hypothetical protein
MSMATVKRCSAAGYLPGARDKYVTALSAYACRPVTADSEGDRSAGWAVYDQPLDLGFTIENVWYNEYICLKYRIDVLRIPANTLKLYQRNRELQWLQDNHREAMPRAQRKALLEQVRTDLRAATLPTIRTIDVIWNTSTGRVWVWTSNARLFDEISVLFEKTFDAELEEVGWMQMGADFCSQEAPGNAADGRPMVDAFCDLDRPGQPAGGQFLTWLWFASEMEESGRTLGAELQMDHVLQLGPVTVALEEAGQPEAAAAALEDGRTVTRARLQLASDGRQYSLVLDTQGTDLAAYRLPGVLSRPEEEQFYERLYLLEELDRTLRGLLCLWVVRRLGPEWFNEEPRMMQWAEGPGADRLREVAA